MVLLFQKSKLPYYNQIEMILVTYVFPDLTSEHGYLRAKVTLSVVIFAVFNGVIACNSIDIMHREISFSE